MSEQVKVEVRREDNTRIRWPDGRVEMVRWVVRCSHCKTNGVGDFLGMLGSPMAIGGHNDFGVLINAAHLHAQGHERERCVTCHHVPVRDESRTKASA